MWREKNGKEEKKEEEVQAVPSLNKIKENDIE